MPPPRNRLDDPGYAAFAWARYRRILKWMALAALLAVLAALAWIYWSGAPMSRHLVIATALGVGLTVLCAGALMGLVFLSSGTGHDEDVGGGD